MVAAYFSFYERWLYPCWCSQVIVISSNLRVTWRASTMAPPPPLTCSVPDCEFATPQGTPTWEIMSTLLNTHTLANHNAGGGTMGGGSSTSAPRLEKLPRPTFQLDMTQSEWAFKYSQWQAYISQTPTQETIKVQQLRVQTIFLGECMTRGTLQTWIQRSSLSNKSRKSQSELSIKLFTYKTSYLGLMHLEPNNS